MFGESLHRHRHRIGLTQRALADAVGTSQPNISAYESGSVSPTFDTAEALLGALGQQVAVGPTMTFSDRRSLEFGKAISVQLLADPRAVLDRGRQNIAKTRKREGLSHERPWLNQWESVLDLHPSVIANLLTDEGVFARDMRSTNPFAGVLSERERAAVSRRTRHEAHSSPV